MRILVTGCIPASFSWVGGHVTCTWHTFHDRLERTVTPFLVLRVFVLNYVPYTFRILSFQFIVQLITAPLYNSLPQVLKGPAKNLARWNVFWVSCRKHVKCKGRIFSRFGLRMFNSSIGYWKVAKDASWSVWINNASCFLEKISLEIHMQRCIWLCDIHLGQVKYFKPRVGCTFENSRDASCFVHLAS